MSQEQIEPLMQLLRERRANRPKGIPEMRAEFETLAQSFPKRSDVTRENIDANVPAAWLRPQDARTDCAMLYLHGGAYVIGSIDTHEAVAGRIAAACRMPALIIDYRLAPEHPFPAALEDAVGAYRWLLAQGFPPDRIAIAGDSAGGGLTAAAMISLRDAGDPPPACGVCISPWTDLAGTGESIQERADRDPIIVPSEIFERANQYLGDADPHDPLASPMYADFTGLSPLLIQVGTEETLYDDAVRMADRARAAGVNVHLEVWDRMPHVWHTLATLVDAADQAIGDIGEFVKSFIPAEAAAESS